MLCLLSFQDWTSINEQIRSDDVDGERINVPSNPRNYWRYRMHLTIEDLQNNTDFSSQVRLLIENSGRG